MDDITKTVLGVICILVCIVIIGSSLLWIISDDVIYTGITTTLYDSVPLSINNKERINTYIPTREDVLYRITQNDINQMCIDNYRKPIYENFNQNIENKQESKSEFISYTEPSMCDARYGTINDIDWHAYVYGYRPTIVLY